MYKILFQRVAVKQLRKVPMISRQRITDKLYALAKDPDNKKLDVKKISGESGFRLRVGDWRIIFDRKDSLKIIEIRKIGPRGGVYK